MKKDIFLGFVWALLLVVAIPTTVFAIAFLWQLENHAYCHLTGGHWIVAAGIADGFGQITFCEYI